MKVEIHQCQSSGARYALLTIIGGILEPLGYLSTHSPPVGLLHQPFVCGDEKSSSTASRIANHKFFRRPGVRPNAFHNRLDQYSRSEVLPGALFPLTGGFLQQSLKSGCLNIHVQRSPFCFVDHTDEFFQIDRVMKPGESTGENITEDSTLLAERSQNIDIVLGQIRT